MALSWQRVEVIAFASHLAQAFGKATPEKGSVPARHDSTNVAARLSASE
jgi:hypothetical protein